MELWKIIFKYVLLVLNDHMGTGFGPVKLPQVEVSALRVSVTRILHTWPWLSQPSLGISIPTRWMFPEPLDLEVVMSKELRAEEYAG